MPQNIMYAQWFLPICFLYNDKHRNMCSELCLLIDANDWREEPWRVRYEVSEDKLTYRRQ